MAYRETSDRLIRRANLSWLPSSRHLKRLNLRLSDHLVPIVILIDAAVAVVASLVGRLAYLLAVSPAQPPDAGAVIGVSIIGAALYVVLAQSWGLYRLPALLEPKRHRGHIVTAWALIGALLSLSLHFEKLVFAMPPEMLAISLTLSGAGLIAAHEAVRLVIKSLLVRGAMAGRKVVIIGEREELSRLSPSFLLYHFGLDEMSRVTLDEPESCKALSSIGKERLRQAMALARDRKADELVIAFRWSNVTLLNAVNETLRRSPLPVRLIPDHAFRRLIGRNDDISSTLSVQLQQAAMSITQRRIKRALDIAAAAAGIALIAPILLVIALAIKIDSSGPVIFRQRRGGFDGREFVIFKFRTMRVLEDGPVIIQTRQGDPRVTRVGEFLRRTSLDELPQLFNVLRGDMSLVGPRPHALAHDLEYEALIADYPFRLHVKPGMTGWAQINGLRGETTHLAVMKRRVELDLWYIRNWSIWLDVWILIRTPLDVISGKAY